MDIQEQKAQIRSEVRGKLKALLPELRMSKSRSICAKLKKTPQYQRAKKIMFYVSTDFEVETLALIREALSEQKTVIVPSLNKNSQTLKPCVIRDLDRDLTIGAYRILEPKLESAQPIDPGEIELVIVPGLAFDHAKNRLGHGKGYYDKFLSKLAPKIPAIGLAFDFQIVKVIPVTELDVRVSRVIHN